MKMTCEITLIIEMVKNVQKLSKSCNRKPIITIPVTRFSTAVCCSKNILFKRALQAEHYYPSIKDDNAQNTFTFAALNIGKLIEHLINPLND